MNVMDATTRTLQGKADPRAKVKAARDTDIRERYGA